MAVESSERVSTDITLESKEGPVLPPPATVQTQPAKLGDGIPASAYVMYVFSLALFATRLLHYTMQ